MRISLSILLGIIGCIQWSFAQTTAEATIIGTITDLLTNEPVELVTLYIKGSQTVTETDVKGNYALKVPANAEFTLVFTRIGYLETTTELKNLPAGAKKRIDVTLAPQDAGLEVVVRESRIRDGGMIREDVKNMKLLPTTTGNLESILPSIALGTSSGSGGELSSQYNVRGGNYDENLVYVNDFQVYRPQLIRAGQQEGLSFPNIDLVQDLSFSSGGFEAKYADKLSSVLDIHYKRPEEMGGSASASLLGATAHIEGAAAINGDSYRKFRYLAGARYKDTRYILGSLDTKGEYTPNFSDIQMYLTYDVSRSWQAALLANYNRSEYLFEPVERTTGFGQVNRALQLFSQFEGKERDDFTTALGGLSLTYVPERAENPLYLKFLASAYQSRENERFDILGFYSLRQIESSLGSDNVGEVIAELGTGTQQTFVRNRLQSVIANVEHKGGVEFTKAFNEEKKIQKSNFVQWSVQYQREAFRDVLNEWERLDSAGYSLPYDTSQVLVYNVLKSKNNIASNRVSGMLQNTYTWERDSVGELRLTYGGRFTYWDVNQELIFSPRAQLLYKPLNTTKDISYRLATGLYVQPPLYRELRRLDGTLNRDLQAQKSVHMLTGLTWDFYMWKISSKKFRFIAEAYYKHLWDVVSYEIENVRIRYSGENDATGYVAGIDMRINGEFVPGAESWFNISFLRARERLNGVEHLTRELGEEEGQPTTFVPRPTDQFMTMSIFFQDYLPRNENFKMNLNLSIGTGLPYGIPNNNIIYRNPYRFNVYHRVDIGFAVLLWNEDRKADKPNHPLRFTKDTWLSLEVFNLMQVPNQASNTWIKTIFQQQYAIPNFLTSRRVNLRVRMDF